MNIRKVTKNRYVLLAIGLSIIPAIALTVEMVAENKHVITGSVTLTGSKADLSKEQGCTGSSGYEDVFSGASVVVKDGSSEIIAASTIKDSGTKLPQFCLFDFTIDNVPRSKVYQIQIAKREPLIYTSEDLEKKGYKIQLKILGG